MYPFPKPLIHELVGVLASKFSRNRGELAHVAVYLSEIAELVRPGRRVKVLDDELDNRRIECAVTGRAAAIVTGDKAMLRLSEYKGIQIITLNDYLASNQTSRFHQFFQRPYTFSWLKAQKKEIVKAVERRIEPLSRGRFPKMATS